MAFTALCVSFLALMILRCPIGFSMGIACLFYFLIADRFPLMVMAHQLSSGIMSYTYLAIPFFILAGSLMNQTGMTQRLFNFALSLVGSLRGGLCHVIIVAEIILSGISGSATADAAGLSTVSIGTMVRKGYPRGFSAGVVASSAVLGPIIPPSILMVIYAVIAECSVGKLFIGGFLPGLVIAFFLMTLVYVTAVKKNFPREEKTNARRIWNSFKAGWLALFAPVVILGGIVIGVCTPTEAGAIAVAYSILLGFLYREFNMRSLPKILLESVHTTALLMFVIATASVFGWIVVNEKVSDLMVELLFSISDNKWVIMMVINLILMFMGCFMETASIMIITIPIFVPIITKLGFDPIYFGVVMTLNVMIGTLTPPVGMVLYITAHIAELPISRAVREILPFYAPLVLSLIILILFPAITMVLPDLLMGR
jgi:tripartite ATP-independent transporter DctM subunit